MINVSALQKFKIESINAVPSINIPQVIFSHKLSRQAEIEVFELGALLERADIAPDPQKPHRINFFMLMSVEQGTGSHMVDFTLYPFQPSSLLFVQREQVQYFDLSNRPQGKVLIFTLAFLDQVHLNMRLPNYTPPHSPLFRLDPANYARIQTLIKEIITEQNEADTDPLLSMYLFSALGLLLRKNNIVGFDI